MADFEDEDELGADELGNIFETASDFVKTLRSLSDEKKLAFYGLFKQVCGFLFLKNDSKNMSVLKTVALYQVFGLFPSLLDLDKAKLKHSPFTPGFLYFVLSNLRDVWDQSRLFPLHSISL